MFLTTHTGKYILTKTTPFTDRQLGRISKQDPSLFSKQVKNKSIVSTQYECV